VWRCFIDASIISSVFGFRERIEGGCMRGAIATAALAPLSHNKQNNSARASPTHAARRYGADSQSYGIATGIFKQPSCRDAAVRQLADARRTAAAARAGAGRPPAEGGLSLEEEEEALQARPLASSRCLWRRRRCCGWGWRWRAAAAAPPLKPPSRAQTPFFPGGGERRGGGRRRGVLPRGADRRRGIPFTAATRFTAPAPRR
jgi:hypothetical protein